MHTNRADAPNSFVQVWYQGMTKVPTPERSMPAILVSDNNDRTIAIPLQQLEGELLRRALQGEDVEPRPYHLLMNCLEKVGGELVSVRIIYTPTYDLRTQLILLTKEGADVEVSAPCSEAVICALVAGVPIHVEEQLMAGISAVPPEVILEQAGTKKPVE